ncbi:UNVERIFIED_ORG: hypothetical protein B2H98_01510 [Clostridium botulinum]|uniref:hypothetical protein n=1 Tax=Clostridium TaxID=1485 RepID=UPI0005975D86|nr:MULTISPECIES: hypothetical protein [Clostridium]KIL07397.1 membrane protein [Clostridium botulinum]MBY6810882.1 hypothetical protein [Clostridium botulinum]MBY6824350.1 hypothetical protein [Clostridium botulinum]MBY6834804.1 hypothetical protein [Clostridium botulinum]MBY6934448.1 hypothetical protein [Clostridium botulinum]
MKKSVLYTGIGYLLCGITFIAVALFTEFKFEGLLCGFGGAGVSCGIVSILKYIHWSKPKNQNEYNKRLKIEKIELEDERKIMIRDKSGCITYKIMLLIYSILIIIFSIINMIGDFKPLSTYIVITFVILLVFQYFCGIFVFNYLNKRL